MARFLLAILLIAVCADGGRAADVDDRSIATVYVTNWTSNSISRFKLSSGGALALQEVIPAPVGSANALGAALPPDKRSLYVAQWGSGSLSPFRIRRDSSLVAGGTVLAAPPSPSDSAQVVVSPDGRRAYMTNFNAGAAGTLSIYDLSRTPRAIATIPTGGEGAAGAVISVDGRTLYVAHMTSGDVTGFRLRKDGSLIRLGTWAAGRGTFVVAVSPDSSRLWAANAISNDIAGFRISPSGRLLPDGPPTSVDGDGPRGLVVAPNGRALYVALYANGDGPGAVAALRVEPSGTLESLGQPVLTAGNGAEAVGLTRDGRRLLVANFNKGEPEGSVTTFQVERSGELSDRQGPFSTGGAEPDFGGLIIVPLR